MCNPLLYGADHQVLIGILQHHDLAHHFFPLPVSRDSPETVGVTELYGSEVADEDGLSVDVLHHDVPDIFNRQGHAGTSDEKCLRSLFNIGSPGIFIIFRQGVIHIDNGDIKRSEPGRIDRNFILLQETAPGVDLHHARNAAELTAYDPVLDSPEVHR